VKIRNKLAHTIKPPKYNPQWRTHIKNMLSSTAKHMKMEVNLEINPYKEIEHILIDKLEVLFK